MKLFSFPPHPTKVKAWHFFDCSLSKKKRVIGLPESDGSQKPISLGRRQGSLATVVGVASVLVITVASDVSVISVSVVLSEPEIVLVDDAIVVITGVIGDSGVVASGDWPSKNEKTFFW